MSESAPASKTQQPKRPRQKRGPNGYGLFAKDQSSKVKSQHPDWTFADISKHVSTLWKGASDAEKKGWQEKAAAIKVTITKNIDPVAGQKSSKKRKRQSNSSAEPRPKKALSAYMFFSKENRADIKNSNPDASFSELAKLVSVAWKQLNEEDKKPYQDLADEDKHRYQKATGAAK
jgi:hypothetical protein